MSIYQYVNADLIQKFNVCFSKYLIAGHCKTNNQASNKQPVSLNMSLDYYVLLYLTFIIALFTSKPD
jgi:hypothetical protein